MPGNVLYGSLDYPSAVLWPHALRMLSLPEIDAIDRLSAGLLLNLVPLPVDTILAGQKIEHWVGEWRVERIEKVGAALIACTIARGDDMLRITDWEILFYLSRNDSSYVEFSFPDIIDD